MARLASVHIVVDFGGKPEVRRQSYSSLDVQVFRKKMIKDGGRPEGCLEWLKMFRLPTSFNVYMKMTRMFADWSALVQVAVLISIAVQEEVK